MSGRLPCPDLDKAAEALALARWLTTSGPSATAWDLRQAGVRLEECITTLDAGQRAVAEAEEHLADWAHIRKAADQLRGLPSHMVSALGALDRILEA